MSEKQERRETIETGEAEIIVALNKIFSDRIMDDLRKTKAAVDYLKNKEASGSDRILKQRFKVDGEEIFGLAINEGKYVIFPLSSKQGTLEHGFYLLKKAGVTEIG